MTTGKVNNQRNCELINYMLQQEIKNQTNNSKYPTNTTYMYVQYKY